MLRMMTTLIEDFSSPLKSLSKLIKLKYLQRVNNLVKVLERVHSQVD